MNSTTTLTRPAEPNAFRVRLRFLILKRASRSGPGRSGLTIPGLTLSGLTMQDARDFLMAYCACFMAVSAFIA